MKSERESAGVGWSPREPTTDTSLMTVKFTYMGPQVRNMRGFGEVSSEKETAWRLLN